MIRLSDAELLERKTLARDLRLHAKHADELARADRERHDSVSERMWRLEAKALRRRAKEHDEAILDERLTRRIERSAARLAASRRAVEALDRVAALIEFGFGTVPAAITTDTLFVEDLGIDEIAFVLVVASVEDEFNVALPDAEAMRMRSVGDLVTWIDARLLAAGSRP